MAAIKKYTPVPSSDASASVTTQGILEAMRLVRGEPLQSAVQPAGTRLEPYEQDYQYIVAFVRRYSFLYRNAVFLQNINGWFYIEQEYPGADSRHFYRICKLADVSSQLTTAHPVDGSMVHAVANAGLYLGRWISPWTRGGNRDHDAVDERRSAVQRTEYPAYDPDLDPSGWGRCEAPAEVPEREYPAYDPDLDPSGWGRCEVPARQAVHVRNS